MSDLRVLITCPQMQRSFAPYEAILRERGIRPELPEVVQQLSEDELESIIGRFDGMIAGDDPMTARVLRAASKLRVIAKWGVGMDNIDRDTAAQLGIRVINTPDVFADEVADVATGYLIMLARGLHQIDANVRAGGWTKIQGVTLSGKTLGVVGLGSIGRATARRAAALGMAVIGSDPLELQRQTAAKDGVTPVDLDEVFGRSDAISFHCPLTSNTFHLFDEKRIRQTRPGIWVINTSRGAVVDQAALIDALASGHVGAAALDVFEHEPLPADSVLRSMDNVILGAHNASNTREAVERVNALALKNLVDGLHEVHRA